MAVVVEEGLGTLIDVDCCIVYLLDEEQKLTTPTVTQQANDERAPVGEVHRVAWAAAEWVVAHGTGMILDGTGLDPGRGGSRRTPQPEPEVSVIASPLMHHAEITGVIVVAKQGRNQFDENGRRVVEIVAAHAAIGFDRCRLYEELHLQATTDELTGVFNRRYLGSRLNEETSRARRNGHPLAALMLDADNFKSVNDRYGHDAGDMVLRDLARLIRAEVRTEDIVARYGGEEFLILLPEVGIHGAASLASRLCRVIAGTPLGTAEHSTLIEVSIGVSILEKDDLEDELIKRADLAMYEAKRSGGNRLCIAQDGRYSLAPTPLLDAHGETAA